jgi:RHS repeat-associated protein
MDMPGRQYNAGTDYRYGFNGKEKDKEVVQYDYGFRIYDPRLVRFKSVDPLSKEYPWNSPYSYAEGDVMRCIDLDGLEKLIINEYYNKDNDKIKTVLSGVRDNKTKEAVNMNMKSALNVKLTNQDIYVIRRDSKGTIFFEGPGGKIDKYYRDVIAKAPTFEGDEVEDLPENTMQQTEITSRGRFIKSALINNIENEFFEKTMYFKPPSPKRVEEQYSHRIDIAPSDGVFQKGDDRWTVDNLLVPIINSTINKVNLNNKLVSDVKVTINLTTVNPNGAAAKLIKERLQIIYPKAEVKINPTTQISPISEGNRASPDDFDFSVKAEAYKKDN